MIPSEFNQDVRVARRKLQLLHEAKIMLEAVSIEGVDNRTGEVILRIPEGQPSKAATRLALLAKRTSGASFGVMKGRKPDVGKLFSFKIPRKSPIEVSKILRKELSDLFREETLIEAVRVPLILNQNAKVKALVKRAFPGYRKRNVGFAIHASGESVTLSGGFWDGGSRTEWFGVKSNGSRFSVTFPTDPPEFSGGKPPQFRLTDDKMIVQGGTSLGKPSTLTFHVTQAVAQRLGVSG